MSEVGLFLLCIFGGKTKSRLRSQPKGSGEEHVTAGTRKDGATEMAGKMPLDGL